MFWSRGAREARRQKVLDELMELDPADRRLRLEHAVVAGDVRSGEVDQALRLIARLDALRVMTLPRTEGISHRLIGAGASAGSEPAPAEDTVAESADWTAAMPQTESQPDTARPTGDLLLSLDDVALTVHTPEPVAVPIDIPELTAFAVFPVAPAGADPAFATTRRPASQPAWTASEPMPLDAVESATRLMSPSRPRRLSTRAQVKVAVSDLRPSIGPDETAGRPDISWLREI